MSYLNKLKNKLLSRYFSKNDLYRYISGMILFMFFLLLIVPSVYSQGKEVKIGVLALRGAEESMGRWTPTAEYLSKQIPEYTFVIVPLDFEQIFEAVKNGEVDFVLENPSIYVELEFHYGIDRIATLNVLSQGKGTNQFGGIIFTHKNRNDINSPEDLRNKSFMAVHETSFGGWRMTQLEFKDLGINPYRDFADIQFGNTHDNVVYAVQDGEVDAGTVRTGILEKMNKESRIDIKDFKILNQKHPDNFSLLISTRLYPEWPFARVKHTSAQLAQQVSIALLKMPADSEAAKVARIAGWTIPNNYQPVHDCLKELRVSPYEDLGKITLANLIQQYWEGILLGFIGVIILATIAVYVIRLNRRLNISTIELEKKSAQLLDSNKELREFAYIVSHDLKAPLRAISQLSHWISKDYESAFDKEGKEMLALLGKRVKWMDRLIDGILQYSRVGRVQKEETIN
ncbi:MAG: PhnD/SsuA/transferrin family substrate-binding protein, partial [Candidatus Aminicenantes bacterium]|nr:PhnD/SsuA/transferrin family substrate-binding protein [Candidatus Aminicenantes bacterium]